LIEVSPHLRKVISKSLEISEATKGAFDITVFDLMSLWGFGPNPKEGLPTYAQIEELKNRTGYQNIILEPEGVRKLNTDLKLDVNAIAKGYGVDQIFEWILDKGFESVFVEIGGEVRSVGKNQDGQDWRVGILDPKISSYPGEELSAIVNLNGKAIATSGNYQNFIEVDGKLLGHTIDPRTGSPVETDVLSVSVVTHSCMEADAWATALMVLNFEEGSKLVSDRTDLDVLWIVETEDGQREIEKTKGFIIENPKY
jgi:thiamine biosynthesis lipoprotein